MMVEEEAQAIDNGGGGSLGSTCWQRRQPRQYNRGGSSVSTERGSPNNISKRKAAQAVA
jgi:hypothetical protein